MGHINLAFAYVASPLFENYRKPKKHDEEMGKVFQQHNNTSPCWKKPGVQKAVDLNVSVLTKI